MSRHPFRLTALALFLGASLVGRFTLAESVIPEPSVQSYVAADGTTYFAVKLAPNAAVPAGGPRDVVVLFDTSASQAGRIRAQAFEALNALTADLDDAARVHLVAVDLEAVPLTPGFASPQGEQYKQALAALGQRAPLGATDMPRALRAAAAQFDPQSTASRCVIYIGDGISSAAYLGLEPYRALLDELVASRISVSSYAVGPRVDGQLLACLANQTGGMLAIDDESIDPKQVGSYLAGAVRGTVLWPISSKWPAELTTVYPEKMPPLRTDRDTIVLGKADGPLPRELKIEVVAQAGAIAEEKTGTRSFHWTLTSGEANPDYAFLPVLVESARVDGGTRLITLGTPGLEEARRIVNEGTHLLGELSRQALVSGNLDTAARLADEALKRDPQDESALAVKKQLAKIRTGGTVAAKTGERLEVKEFSNEQATPPGPADAAPRPPVPPAPTDDLEPALPAYDDVNEGEGRLLENIEQHNRLMTDLIRTEVEGALRAARARMDSDPASVEDDLKLMLGRVVRSPELKAEVRAQLRGQLEEALRESARRAATHDILRQQQEVARAAALDRLRIANNLIRKEEKIKQLMDRFNSLMEEGRYLAADQIGEMEVAQLAPELPIAQSATWTAHMTGAREADRALRMARQKAVVDTLGTVEVALMPFPDDQPVVYPPADEWLELTERRKRYTATDLKTVTPIEKKIREALQSTTKMEFTEMPLIDAVDYLKDYHDIEIQLDNRALEDAGVGSDTPVTRMVNGISLKSGLRLLLGEYDLTYLIKDEVLLITTVDKAETELVTKAYPVADLVIPVQSISTGGGLGGGIGGGGGGGGFGGGGGGFGGGGGGFGGGGGGFGDGGGGMFAVPDDLKLGPKSKSQTAAAKAAPQAAAKAGAAKPGLAKTPAAKGDAAKPARKPVAIELAISPGVDAEVAWSDYFASHANVADADVRETVRQRMQARKFEETEGLIRAALRLGKPQPWMYEALALAMQVGGSPQGDVERALMSAVDFGNSSDELLYVAQYMGRIGLESRALQVFHQVSMIEPLRPEPYLYGLQLAQRTGDVEGIRWSSLGILRQAWPKEKATIVEQAKRAAAGAIVELKSANRTEEANQFQADLDKASIRDCIIKVTWTGDADVDLMVEEPSGAVCAFRNPRTAGGGVLLGDSHSSDPRGAGGATTETYECPEAFAGSYRVLIRRVWGKVTAGKVTVDLYAHYGTPQQKHMHEQIHLGEQDAMVVFDLPEGRRQEPLAEQQLVNAAQTQLAVNQAILAQQINEVANTSQGANGRLSVSRNGLFGIPLVNQAVGFQPVITVLPAGTSLSVSGVVSADRRYVRITPVPLFSGVSSVTTFNLVSGTTGTTPGTGGGTQPGATPPGAAN